MNDHELFTDMYIYKLRLTLINAVKICCLLLFHVMLMLSSLANSVIQGSRLLLIVIAFTPMQFRFQAPTFTSVVSSVSHLVGID